MGTGWKKIVGMAVVAGAIGAMALGAVAFAQSPTPTAPTQNNNTAPTQNNAPFGWFGSGPMGGMRGGLDFGGRGFGIGQQDFGHDMRGAGGFLNAAATAFNMTAQDLFTQLQSGKTLADIAKEKNVDTTKLVSDYVATFSDSLKTAVTNNQLTQAQADARVAEAKADAEALLNQKFNATAFGHDMRGAGGFLSAAATAFNMTAQDLYTQLQSGKTLADIAKEKNVDTTKLVSDYVATFAASLKTAVSNGQLTQAQADARLAEIKADAEALLTQKLNANSFGQPGLGNFGPGFHGGRGGGNGRGFGPFQQQQPQQQQQVAPQGTQQSY